MKRAFGKFEIQEIIGEGGFGRVFRAYDTVLKRQVAIKTYTLDDPTVRQRFMREAEIAAGLTHPNIVVIHDLGEHDGEPFIVQEYLPGEDLDAIIRRREPLPLDEKIRYLAAIADALAFAHGRGVIHRDVKPQNVRILTSGDVRVLDFGIAKRAVEDATALTQAGASIGTIGYMAPEQLRAERIDHRVDIFSFGALAFQLLTFESPFTGDSMATVLYQLAHVDPTWPPGSREALPSPLVELVDRCLAKDPEVRPQSCGEVVAALHRVGEGAASPRSDPGSGVDPQATRVAPTPPSFDERAPVPPRTLGKGRRSAAVGVAGVGILAWVLWLAGAIGGRQDSAPPGIEAPSSGEVEAATGDAAPRGEGGTSRPGSEPPDPDGAGLPPASRPTNPGLAAESDTDLPEPPTLDRGIAITAVSGNAGPGPVQVVTDLVSGILMDAGFTLRAHQSGGAGGGEPVVGAARSVGAGLAVEVQLNITDLDEENEFGMASAGATLTLVAVDVASGSVFARAAGQSTGGGTGIGMATTNAVRRAFEQVGAEFGSRVSAWRNP